MHHQLLDLPSKNFKAIPVGESKDTRSEMNEAVTQENWLEVLLITLDKAV